MFRWIKNVIYLSGKELRSLFSDPVLVVLIIYMFTIAVYTVANSITLSIMIIPHCLTACNKASLRRISVKYIRLTLIRRIA